MDQKFRSLVLLAQTLFVLMFVFMVYAFLHEGGHAVLGIFFGQSMTEFVINGWSLSAHVGLAGGHLTRFQHAIQSAAGASLPLVLWAILMVFVPRRGNLILEELKVISSMTVINTLLAWIVLPILFLWGQAPSDDVTNFLRYSLISPLVLTLVASGLYIGGWRLFILKINGLRNELRLFRTMNRENVGAGTRNVIIGMAGVMAFCAIVVFVLNGLAVKNSMDKFSPPQDMALVTQIDLSTRAYTSEPIWQFNLNEPTWVSVFIVVRNIDTTFFDLSAIGPNSFRSTVLHGEGYRASQDGGLWEQSLSAGTYQLMLTSHPSTGIVSIYLMTD